MKLIDRVKSVASNPKMLSAYTRWVGSRVFTGKPPMLSLYGGARVGGWVSFSEYWSFQNIVPEPERLFVQRSLTARIGGQRVAFDVGANLGGFSCLIASMGRYRVHAFEPIPETYCRLK